MNLTRIMTVVLLFALANGQEGERFNANTATSLK
jgi:hypothetical protein